MKINKIQQKKISSKEIKIFLFLITSIFFTSCARSGGVFGPYTLHEIDNVVEYLQDTKIAAIEVSFCNEYLDASKCDTTFHFLLSSNLPDTLNTIFYEFITQKLFLSKINLNNSQVYASNNSCGRITLTLDNSVEIIINWLNTYGSKNINMHVRDGNVVLWSRKSSPSLIEIIPFLFKRKGVVEYSTTKSFNTSIVYGDIVNLNNILIGYYNQNLDSIKIKINQLEIPKKIK